MVETTIRFGLGAAAMIVGTATQWFWELVERGESVRPDDPGLAGAIERTLTIAVPTSVGAALGTAIDGGLRAGERTAKLAAGTADELARFVVAVLHRAGVPERAELQRIGRRLDAVAAALDDIEAEYEKRPTRPARRRTR